MEWNPETLEFLSQCFLHTLSPAPEPRRHAEASLSAAADSPNYGLAVLRLVAEPSVDEQIRIAAAVNFKNHLRARWAPASADDPNSPVFFLITDAEKDQIKALIVQLMLSSTPKIQSQLSEALALIGKHDFPKLWPALLPVLVANLQKAAQASDYSSINGILGTANSIFKKFRYQYKTNDLLLDLKYCWIILPHRYWKSFSKPALWLMLLRILAHLPRPLSRFLSLRSCVAEYFIH